MIERTRADMSPTAHFHEELAPELRQMIREELDRLPDCYRQPVTLCYMEGLTHQEAANRLGWPVGTVKVRLVRGRRLSARATRSSGRQSGGALLLWLLNPSRAPAVPQPLLESTVRVMNLGAAGRRAALESKFAALRMADTALGVGIALKVHWGWPIVVLAVIMLGLSGSAALAFHGKPAPGRRPHDATRQSHGHSQR